MKLATTPNPECEKASLKVLRLVEKVVPQGNGAPVRLSYWQQSTKKLEGVTRINFPVYNRQRDGNVFDWLISTAEDFRKIRQRERWNEFKKASEKSKGMDPTKVAD
jgi:arginine/lysine/ornithine decarboxylase